MLAERREARRASREGRRRERSRAEFFFDLACPFTYLAAERVERAFDDVTWTPASAEALRRSCLADDTVAAAAVRKAAEERAAALRMPLVWPERVPTDVSAAMRGAAVSSTKRWNEKVQDAGTPCLSRYQLLQPVTQTVLRPAARRSSSNCWSAACVGLISR